MSHQMTLTAAPANRWHSMSDKARGVATTVGALWHWFNQGKRKASLASLSDHTLKDIGIHRSQIISTE